MCRKKLLSAALNLWNHMVNKFPLPPHRPDNIIRRKWKLLRYQRFSHARINTTENIIQMFDIESQIYDKIARALIILHSQKTRKNCKLRRRNKKNNNNNTCAQMVKRIRIGVGILDAGAWVAWTQRSGQRSGQPGHGGVGSLDTAEFVTEWIAWTQRSGQRSGQPEHSGFSSRVGSLEAAEWVDWSLRW